MALLEFDELNILGIERRSMPYEKFFGEMDISEEEKEKRIEMAQRFEMLFAFYFMEYGSDDDDRDWVSYITEHYTEIAMLFVTATVTPAYIQDHAKRLAEEVTRVTNDRVSQADIAVIENGDDVPDDIVFWISRDRATLIAENESNTVGNYDEMIVAIRSGMTTKTWNTMRDNKVRHTHREVDGVTVGILEPFKVGNSLLMFPGDAETYGADLDEIANCRCHATYS